MDITYYAFATYVFILLCTVLWLLGRILRKQGKKRKDGEKSTGEKEQRLFSLYQNIEDMLAGFEEYVEEAREDAERAKADIKALLENARSAAALPEREQTKAAEPTDTAAPKAVPQSAPCASTVVRAAYRASASVQAAPEKVQPVSAEEPVPASPRLQIVADQTKRPASFHGIRHKTAEPASTRTAEKVAALAAHGLDTGEIAQQLGISFREASLAMQLDRRGDKKCAERA